MFACMLQENQVIFVEKAGNIENLVELGHKADDPEIILGVVMTINNCANTGLAKLNDVTIYHLLQKIIDETDDPDIKREAEQALDILKPNSILFLIKNSCSKLSQTMCYSSSFVICFLAFGAVLSRKY